MAEVAVFRKGVIDAAKEGDGIGIGDGSGVKAVF